jgi:hypothetical protein
VATLGRKLLELPLSYITRKNDEPDYSGEDDTDFEMLTIACAPLSGIVYQADTKTVHQLILGFVQGEDAVTWIKDTMKKQDGRLDMKYLRHHYSGAGSQSVRIKQAEAVHTNLVYKNERTLSFERFGRQLGDMFTAYSDNDEPLLNRRGSDSCSTRCSTRCWRL